MKKVIVTGLGLLIGTQVLAAPIVAKKKIRQKQTQTTTTNASVGATAPTTENTSTTSASSLYDKLKASPLKLSQSIINESVRNTTEKQINGSLTYFDTYLSYNLSKQDSVRLFSEFTREDHANDATDPLYNYEDIHARYSRSGILSQASNGIMDLSAEARLGWIPDAKRQNEVNNKGYFETRLNANHSFNKVFSLKSTLRYNLYSKEYRNTGIDKNDTRFDRIRLYLIPTITPTEKLTLSTMFLYTQARNNSNFNTDSANKARTAENIVIEQNVNYAFASWFDMDVYAGINKLEKSHDNQNFTDEDMSSINKRIYAAFALNFNIF